jgi:regulator of cell morphogenesis and NO signaling
LNRIATRHGQDRPRLVHLRNVFAKFMVDMLEHMDNEEQHVFAAARKLDQGIVESHDRDGRDPMQLMMEEHDEGAMALMKMREYSDNFTAPADACDTFKQVMADLARLERDMHEHVYKENCILAFKAEQAERRLLARA